jgi:hypothetical protein
VKITHDPLAQDTHYVRSLRDIPPCGGPGGHMTTAFWDVTCDPCLNSLTLAIDQFRLARQQLWAALKLSLRSRHKRNGS